MGTFILILLIYICFSIVCFFVSLHIEKQGDHISWVDAYERSGGSWIISFIPIFNVIVVLIFLHNNYEDLIDKFIINILKKLDK